MTEYREFPCDLCGSNHHAEIPAALHYTGGNPLHVCRDCGFVYIRRRRSAQDIADAWSHEVYQTRYTARVPYVFARQAYVAEFTNATLDLKGKSLLDVGAGEGQFLEVTRTLGYGVEASGLEPSAANCEIIRKAGFPVTQGTVEEFVADPANHGRYDVATVMWTLENCQDCKTFLNGVHDLLRPGGHVVVATGSRILVPFKKPLNMYLTPNEPDTHCFRFSANALRGALAVTGFEMAHVNRYLDGDFLVMVGRKVPRGTAIAWPKDDWLDVVGFFERWHEETRNHYADAKA
jgi:SAM-dependent methyltransferase